MPNRIPFGLPSLLADGLRALSRWMAYLERERSRIETIAATAKYLTGVLLLLTAGAPERIEQAVHRIERMANPTFLLRC